MLLLLARIFVCLLVGAGVGVGYLLTTPYVDPRIPIFVVSSLLAACFGFFGRYDLSRPHVALPLAWYTAAAIAQLKVLDYETEWSPTASWLILTCPLLFALGSWTVSGGTTRPTFAQPMELLNSLSRSRLVLAGLVLLAVGILGTYVKSRITGGLLLLSDDIDRNRGGARVSGWVTLMTDCAFIAFWVFLLRLTRPGGRVWIGLLAGSALFLVALNASRNVILLALLVPAVYCYLIGATSRLRGRAAVGVTAFVLICLLTASGLFYLRTSQHRGSAFESYFYSDVVATTPVALRPLLPLYISMATPFETYNRITDVFPRAEGYGGGSFSTYGIPPVLNPIERTSLYERTGPLSRPYYFNVATYQAPLYADGGWAWVAIGSLLFGIALGAARTWLVVRRTAASIAVAAYLTYLTVFLVYENVFGLFTMSVIWDMIVVAGVLGWASRAGEIAGPQIGPAQRPDTGVSRRPRALPS